MVRVHPDPYLVLGVAPTATQAAITHPHRPPYTRPARAPPPPHNHLRRVRPAYALLRDPARRADYDRATADAANTRPRTPAVPIPAERPSAGRVQIPITHRYNKTPTTPVPPPPLRAGPVRGHR